LRFIAGTPGNVESSVPGRAVLDWAASVEEMSGGRLEIQILNGAAPDPELFDIVLEGGGDLCQQPIMFNSGRFPTLEALVLPDMGTVDRHPSKTTWDLWHAMPEAVEKEFEGVQLISVWCATQAPPGISFATVDKPIRSIEDFQGVKIGVYGNWGTKLMEALGAVPVAVIPPEIYESMQRKIVDGSCMDPEILESNMVYEVAKYWHNLNFQFVPFYFICNGDVWNTIPADLQQIMLDAGSKMPDQIDADFRESVVRALDTAVNEHGIEVIDYSPEELAKWQAAQDPLQDEYVAYMNERGVDGQAVMDLIVDLHAKHAEW
jgi:TRAP-type C4-dicarboxylate transport system substrate-binding protein